MTLLELAEQIERAAVSDAKEAANNGLYAKRAADKFAVAAALRTRSTQEGDTHDGTE